MLTFDDLRKTKKEEEASAKLSKINPDFKEAVSAFLGEKQKESQEKRDLRELQNIKSLLKEILEIRERKILTAALYYVRSGVMPDNLVQEEKEFFDDVSGRIKKFHDTVKTTIRGVESKMRMVIMREPVPSFVGTNMRIYGPFKAGDITTMPEDCAELLIKKEMASPANQ